MEFLKDKYEQFQPQKKFILAVFIPFVLFLFSLLIFDSTWGINDDVIMAMHASGKGFAIEQTEYLIHSNIIIGYVLKELYRINPSFPWYGFYTIFILLIAFTTLLYSLLAYRYSKSRIIYFLLFFALFGLWLLRMPQFTTNAFVIGMSGVFLFLSVLYKWESWHSSLYRAIPIAASIIFLAISSMIRIDSFYLILILSLPLVLIEMAKGNLKKKIIWRICAFSFALAIIVISAYSYNKYKYSQWEYMIKKQRLIVEILDNNKIMEYSPGTKSIFEKAGWSINDFFLMRQGVFADEGVFSIEKMERALKDLESAPSKRPMIHFEYMLNDKYFYGALLLVISFLIFMDNKKRKSLEVIIPFTASLVLIVYLAYYVRLPDRIYMSIMSFVAFLLIYFSGNDIKSEASSWRNKIKYLFIIFFITSFLYIHYASSTVKKYNNSMFKKYISQLNQIRDHTLLVWGGSLPVEYISVFDDLEDFSNLRLLTVGLFKNPGSIGILNEINIATFDELIRKDNLIHIGNAEYMVLFSQYLKEHHNMDVAFRIFKNYSVNESLMAYKCVGLTTELKKEATLVTVNVNGIKYEVFVIFDM